MIVIMGSVGSGKTEQSERLVKKLSCRRISTSQLLRDHPAQKWHGHILAGKLVNDQDIINLLVPEISALVDKDEEFILDGAPRSIVQAKWLIDQIKSKQIMLKGIINLKVSDEVVLKRLLSRGREDDNQQVIIKRLSDYHEITQPVLKYLEKNGIEVYQVNGENSPDDVEKEIDEILEI